MANSFERIMLQLLAQKYGIKMDTDIEINPLDDELKNEYRRILDKIIVAILDKIIESEELHKILTVEFTPLERISLILPALFDVQLSEIEEMTCSTNSSIRTQRSIGKKKLKKILHKNDTE